METSLEKISRNTATKQTECKCNGCKAMCKHQVCLGTPQDILALINAGYKNHLAYTVWAVGIVMGVTNHQIPMVQIKYDHERRSCPFFFDGLCDLHAGGLKPTEGKLAIHLQAHRDSKRSLPWNVAKEWLDPLNYETIAEIIVKMSAS